MITTKDLYASCSISPEVYDYCEGIAEELKERFLTRLNDLKVQQIVDNETHDLRTILYVKAFANNDDFDAINE